MDCLWKDRGGRWGEGAAAQCRAAVRTRHSIPARPNILITSPAQIWPTALLHANTTGWPKYILPTHQLLQQADGANKIIAEYHLYVNLHKAVRYRVYDQSRLYFNSTLAVWAAQSNVATGWIWGWMRRWSQKWPRVEQMWLAIHTDDRMIDEEDMGDLLSHRSTWQANVPKPQREGQATTRASLCCPTCPEVLLLCSNPHPITLSTWGRSLISSVMCCVCVFAHTCTP